MALPLEKLTFPAFRQRLPWLGGDIQSMAFNYLAKDCDLDAWDERRVEVALPDGSGDRLVHRLDLPQECDTADAEEGCRPLVVLLHGLGGHAEEGYILLASRFLLQRGHPVLRYNNRGCGIGRDFASRGHWPGDTLALRATLEHLHREHPEQTAGGIGIIAYSLGSSLLVAWLAEAGEAHERGEENPHRGVFAAATISGPIDLHMTSRHLSGLRSIAYRKYLMTKIRYEIDRPSLSMTDAEREVVEGARTIWEFDDGFTAHRHGFEGAREFYAACHMAPKLPRVRIPLLMIASRDDPFVPFEMYRRHDFSNDPYVTPLLCDRGGHCGFHGVGEIDAWCDRMAIRFIEHHQPARQGQL